MYQHLYSVDDSSETQTSRQAAKNMDRKPSNEPRNHAISVSKNSVSLVQSKVGVPLLLKHVEYTRLDPCMMVFLYFVGLLTPLVCAAVIAVGMGLKLARIQDGTNKILSVAAHLVFSILLVVLALSILKSSFSVLKNGTKIVPRAPEPSKSSNSSKISKNFKNCVGSVSRKLSSMRFECRPCVLRNVRSSLLHSKKYANDHELDFAAKSKQTILFVIQAWILLQWGELLKHLPLDIAANIAYGLFFLNFYKLATGFANLFSDLFDVLQVYFRKWKFLETCKCFRCCCCCCGGCDSCWNGCCFSSCRAYFPKHHVHYFDYVARLVMWSSGAKIAAGATQVTLALIDASASYQKFDTVNDVYQSFEVFLYCYNFASGIYAIIKACKKFFIVYYQFCFYWSQNKISVQENEVMVRTIESLFTSIGLVFKVSMESKDSQNLDVVDNVNHEKIDRERWSTFALIDEMKQPSDKFRHHCGCFPFLMYFNIIVVGGSICVFVLSQTASFVDLDLPVLDEINSLSF